MMINETINALYRYNSWANTHILNTSASLSPDQFVDKRGASYDSVHATLVHTMSAEWIWLSRWQGVSPSAMFDPADFPDPASIRRRWDAIKQKSQDFLAQIDEVLLTRIVEYTNTKGERWAYPLWQQMIHQINHATQHRSEIAVILTSFGHSPGDLDFLYYLDLRAKGA